ncbi:MAG: OpgC domain-containing protein [Candidatus Bathyarchaeota archaeon]|nr:MAG: OpgC domain-containing protein [Candidatus Bathyarchaeota archaeon]
MMDGSQKFKRRAPVIFICAIIIVLAFIWSITFPPSVWQETPNYLQMYIDFVVTKPTDAFLAVSTGPGGGTGLVFIPTYSLIVVHIIFYVVGKQRSRKYTFLNQRYIVYLVLLALFAISFQNASQHYGWYLNPNFTDEAGLPAPGYVDTWTHITSPWLLGALIIPLALERYLGWDRKYMWIFMFAVLAIVALGWEIMETVGVNISEDVTYFNYPMDSLKDLIMGAVIAPILSCLIYERIVMDLDKKV